MTQDADVDRLGGLIVALSTTETASDRSGVGRNVMVFLPTQQPRGKYNSRSVAVGDEDGNLVILLILRAGGHQYWLLLMMLPTYL